MTGALVPPAEPDLVAIAKRKLATQSIRAAELEHLAYVLQRDEQVVTLCDALFRSGRQERRGLIALTDERLICVPLGSRDGPLAELRLPAITSVTVSAPRGWGDAKRGQLTTLSGGVATQLDRVRPWERAEEIAEHIQADIDGRALSGSFAPGCRDASGAPQGEMRPELSNGR
ncbi:MAG TPA: hypothetical protein VH300_13115 [Thermoleophilaceae bacterium]|nr:hypothetical protein [Thermoleophilaceae bacterium]